MSEVVRGIWHPTLAGLSREVGPRKENRGMALTEQRFRVEKDSMGR